jgi:glycine betaine/proline transport system substrate-binding protein
MRITVRSLIVCQAMVVGSITGPAMASEPAMCQSPRFSDIGWTDITLTTAMTAGILETLGYTPKISLLSTDVTYEEMRNKQIDIFLGTWIPGLQSASQPYRDKGAIETVRTNLTGAMSTLAVPRYVYDAGVKSLADLAARKAEFKGTIYGLAPGSNKPIEDLIAHDVDGLGSWTLSETSEAGMLAQVTRSIGRKEPVVFYAWAPHPMNTMFDIAYLAGGDEYIGPDYGASTVLTDVRAGYLADCPNIARLLKNLAFSVSAENEMMTPIMQQTEEPKAAAIEWIKKNPSWLSQTLDGVTTFEGEPALPLAKSAFGLQ